MTNFTKDEILKKERVTNIPFDVLESMVTRLKEQGEDTIPAVVTIDQQTFEPIIVALVAVPYSVSE